MTPDVNVLVAASRSDHPHHRVAHAWLTAAAAAASTGGSLVLLPMVLAGLVRLVTSPKIFQVPTPVEDAVAFVDALLAVQGVRVPTLGPEWPRLRQLCLDKQLKGNAVPDAWIAAATIHLGEHLVSFDRDFKKLIGRAQFTLLEPQAR
jgi:toxin-antitoxin system PIN domain toxin